MNRRFAAGLAFAMGAVCLIAPPSRAQVESNLGALSPQNVKGYLAPLDHALSTLMNSAVFQSGAVPKQGVSFAVGARVMGITFKDEDRTYTPTDPPGFTGTGTVSAPTVIGSTQSVSQPGQGGTTLYHPGGLDMENLAIAAPQLTIGSIAGTRLLVRWISLDVGDSELGNFELWGIGGQHSISQYFPGMPVDLAVGALYQSFHIGDDKLIDVTAFHGDVTGSKKFGMLEPYVSVGFDNLGMEANYTSNSGSPGTKQNVKFDSETVAHFTVGATLGLPVIKLNAEFDSAKVTGFAAGLSFGMGR